TPPPYHLRPASLQPDSARWFGRSSTKEQWRPIVGGRLQQVNDRAGAPTWVWLKHFNHLSNLTLGYNAIRDRSSSDRPGHVDHSSLKKQHARAFRNVNA